MGRHTKRGGYLIEWEKVRSFVVPDLTGFKVNRHGTLDNTDEENMLLTLGTFLCVC